MASQQIRIRLKSYEHSILDESAAKIVATAQRTGAEISGPHVNNLKFVRISD